MGSNPLTLPSCFNFFRTCNTGESPKIEWYQTWHTAIRITLRFKKLDNWNLSYKSPHWLLVKNYSQMFSWQYNPQDTPSHPTRHTVTPHKTHHHTLEDTPSHPTRHTVTPHKTHRHTPQDAPSHPTRLQSSAILLWDPHILNFSLCECCCGRPRTGTPCFISLIFFYFNSLFPCQSVW